MAQAVCECNRAHEHHCVQYAVNARHNTEDVVVGGVHADGGRQVGANSVVGDRQQQRGVVNTRQVARARRLVLLRLESERVHVDTNSGDVGVVLERLNQVEVVAVANLEAVVAVELQQSRDRGVLASHALNAGDGVARFQDRAIPPVRVVERLLSLPGVDDGVIARDVRVTLDDPHQFLARVVEVQLQLVGRRGDGLTASELEDVNQVLVRDLGELTTLIRVQVDVVHVQRGSGQTALADTVANGVGISRVGVVPAQVVQRVELQVDADLVVLQSNERQSQPRVAAEPELQRDVQGVHRGTRGDDFRGQRLAAIAVVVARRAALVEQVRQFRDVTDHLGITSLLAGLLGQFVPDVQPITVLLVNALATDFNFNVVNQVVTDPVQPTELSTRAVRRLEGDLRQGGLQVHAVDQITVALNRARNLLAEVGSTVKRVLNGLHGEVGVTTVHNLKKRNLRVASQVNILGTIGDKLHQTTTSHFSIPSTNKKILEKHKFLNFGKFGGFKND